MKFASKHNSTSQHTHSHAYTQTHTLIKTGLKCARPHKSLKTTYRSKKSHADIRKQQERRGEEKERKERKEEEKVSKEGLRKNR